MDKYVKEGKLVVLGIAQEQHPHRNRLFTQWHRITWPVLYDPINLMQVTGVPIEVAIDEHGIVRSRRVKAATVERDFLNKTFPAGDTKPAATAKATRPDLSALARHATQTNSADAWRTLGDTLALWGGEDRIDDAIDAYTRAVRSDPNDGDAHFRLGVCLRMRYESSQRMRGDFQGAVDHWTMARQINPNQYIWRRRIEQYGPRQTKPYPFYDWVDAAQQDIESRGDRPVVLKTLPTDSELAQPKRGFAPVAEEAVSPDPQGRVFRDTRKMIATEVTVVPPRAKAGQTVRVHVSFRPNDTRKAHWNNEAEPLTFWIDPVEGLDITPQLLTAPQGSQPETAEPRHVEFEVRARSGMSGTVKLKTYALYYVCEDVGGTCTYLRQDIPVTVTVEP